MNQNGYRPAGVYMGQVIERSRAEHTCARGRVGRRSIQVCPACHPTLYVAAGARHKQLAAAAQHRKPGRAS